jgi:hypothetical protein
MLGIRGNSSFESSNGFDFLLSMSISELISVSCFTLGDLGDRLGFEVVYLLGLVALKRISQ